MKRKLTALLLALVLVTGLALPAAAEDTGTALERVTEIVKDTLDLDTAGFDTFRGDRYEGELSAAWTLRWSGTAGDLTVQAQDDGTITSYRLSQDDYVTNIVGFPSFPQGDEAAAARSAQAFLDKVLRAGESAALGTPRGMDTLGGDSFRFSGTLLLNGLPSPLDYSVTVRASDNQVTNFSRTAPENLFLGEVPGSRASVSEAQARETLAASLAVKLAYVRSEEESTAAVLRYLPADTDLFYVDARTGEALNMTELGGVGNMGGAGESAGDTTADGADNGLTAAEQEGIAKLEGVLPSDTLDSRLRGQGVYGLEGFTLSSAAYQLIEADGETQEQVLCILAYTASSAEDYRTRTVTVDARTGAVESVCSYAPRLGEEETPALTMAAAQARAEDFLAAFAGARWENLVLYESRDNTADRRPYYTFTYVQQVNAIPFPENFYTVAVACTDGSVYSLDYRYDDSMTFQNPEGIVEEAAAQAAWADTYETVLAYRLVPRPLNSSDAKEQRLLSLGFTQFYALRLTYALEREENCLGIDAHSGEPVRPEEQESADIAYTDIAGTWVQADVETLAAYGVGYAGGVFRHQKKLTQWDLVALLASLDGYRIDPEDADAALVDSAYASAYRMGALTRDERDEDRLISRGELVQRLLDCAGYGPAARLQGIYTCSYSDAASIPKESLGYAAIAQALGLMDGRYEGSRTATRGELAAMLCRLLGR